MSTSNVGQVVSSAIADIVMKTCYPYQLRYIADRSLRKAWLSSRQIGKTRTAGAEAVLDALEQPGRTVILASASDRRAQELLLYVIWWADQVDQVLKAAGLKSVYAARPSMSEVRFFNGSRVISLPANPRTLSGYTGPVKWDEVAKTPDDDEMYTALSGVTSAGPYSLSLLSSPWGARGVFWKACTGQMKGWNVHQTTIYDAVADGLPRNIEFLRSQYDALMFAQEYECKFVSKEMNAFPPDVLLLCQKVLLPKAPPPGIRDIQGALPRYALGIDFARTSDKTAAIWLSEYPAGHWQATRIESMKGVGFTEQYQTLFGYVANEGVEHVGIDAGGNGQQIAEDLYRAFPGKVQRIMFDPKKKSAMVSLALARMESGLVSLDPDLSNMPDLVAALGSIQRKVLPSGVVTYDAPHDGAGHADEAIAFLLAFAQVAATTGFLNFDVGLGDNDPAASGSIDVRGQIARSIGSGVALTANGPQIDLVAAGLMESSPWTPEDIAAMSPAEKRAFGLVDEGPGHEAKRPGPVGLAEAFKRSYEDRGGW